MANTNPKIKDLKEPLIIKLAKESDTDTPVYPSAQMWYNMTQKEKDELKTLVNWTDFETEMKKHWPKGKRA